MQYRILVYALGGKYNAFYNSIKYLEDTQQIQVIGLISSYDYPFRTLDGYRVFYNRELESLSGEYDYIMIMNEKHFKAISQALLERGVGSDKILSYRILKIPNLKMEDYIQVKQSRISIISNNCWGGTVYHALGLECLSPFKNLFLKDDDFLKLLGNLRTYCEMPLEFDSYEMDVQGKYPKMRLGDIYIYCNHDKDEQSALEKWNRRVKKINYDNIFVEMYTLNKTTAEKFDALPYHNKIVFVPFPAYQQSHYQLSLLENETEFWQAVNHNASMDALSRSYSLVDLLLGRRIERSNS